MTAIPLMTRSVILPSTFPRVLRAIRDRHGMTLRDAAKASGVPLATFQRVERGGAYGVQTLWALDAFCKVWARKRALRSSLNSGRQG